MPSSDRPALVLFSGGQDSTTCLFWALRRFARVEAIGFDYGQRHAVELRQARRIAERAGVPFAVRRLDGALGGSALLDPDADVNAPHARDPDLPASFVPGRNALFLSLAAAHAYNRGIHDLVGGMCQTDYSGYPDCRRVFLDSMQASLSLALDADLRIHTPLMYRTKAETWKLAADLGRVSPQGADAGADALDVLEVVRTESHTDYHGDRSQLHPWGYGRLDNPASKLRAKGYAEAKAKGWV
jgi:7-cyano-7-deazaguanine synthase